jgi:hypothetical protein
MHKINNALDKLYYKGYTVPKSLRFGGRAFDLMYIKLSGTFVVYKSDKTPSKFIPYE